MYLSIQGERWHLRFSHYRDLGVTGAAIAPGNGTILYGDALLHRDDHYVKAIGRKVALTRAISTLPRPVRAEIWRAYLQRCRV